MLRYTSCTPNTHLHVPVCLISNHLEAFRFLLVNWYLKDVWLMITGNSGKWLNLLIILPASLSDTYFFCLRENMNILNVYIYRAPFLCSCFAWKFDKTIGTWSWNQADMWLKLMFLVLNFGLTQKKLTSWIFQMKWEQFGTYKKYKL